jgi:hypothetical protein
MVSDFEMALRLCPVGCDGPSQLSHPEVIPSWFLRASLEDTGSSSLKNLSKFTSPIVI